MATGGEAVATIELVNAVATIRERLSAMMRESRAAAETARLAGRPQFPALNANALERLRVSSILPSLPDNDWILDMVRQSKGEPSRRMCDLTEQEVGECTGSTT